MDGDDIVDYFFGSDFESINKRMERMFSSIEDMNNGGFRTYGYTMYRGPDGIPHVQEFGNSSNDDGVSVISSGGIGEPLIDVTRDNGVVRAVMEIPGVSKEDIVLEGNKNTLSVTIDSPSKQFAKTLALPCDVDPDSAKAAYNNGILEVTLTVIDEQSKGKRIAIE